jgi:hypothetical protein
MTAGAGAEHALPTWSAAPPGAATGHVRSASCLLYSARLLC